MKKVVNIESISMADLDDMILIKKWCDAAVRNDSIILVRMAYQYFMIWYRDMEYTFMHNGTVPRCIFTRSNRDGHIFEGIFHTHPNIMNGLPDRTVHMIATSLYVLHFIQGLSHLSKTYNLVLSRIDTIGLTIIKKYLTHTKERWSMLFEFIGYRWRPVTRYLIRRGNSDLPDLYGSRSLDTYSPKAIRDIDEILKPLVLSLILLSCEIYASVEPTGTTHLIEGFKHTRSTHSAGFDIATMNTAFATKKYGKVPMPIASSRYSRRIYQQSMGITSITIMNGTDDTLETANIIYTARDHMFTNLQLPFAVTSGNRDRGAVVYMSSKIFD